MKIFHVVGLDHGLQVAPKALSIREYEHPADIPLQAIEEAIASSLEFKKRNAAYENALTKIIKTKNISLVAEEAENKRTIAQEIAEAHHCEYLNITMPLEIRTESQDSPKYKGMLEEFMVSAISKKAGSGSRTLILCGAEHMNAIGEMLQADETTVSNEDFCKADWYQQFKLSNS